MPLLLVLAAAVLLPGCGGGGATATDSAENMPYPWLKGPSREFLIPDGDNVVQTFGDEGTSRERAEATAVITRWLRAREAKNLRKDCSYFSRAYAKVLADDVLQVTDGKARTCPGALAYFEEHASGNYVNTLSGSINSLRVGEGQRVDGTPGAMAFAQYHGNDGNDWVVPLEREGGEWKIAKAAPINRLQ
jgi:hypothetical protein